MKFLLNSIVCLLACVGMAVAQNARLDSTFMYNDLETKKIKQTFNPIFAGEKEIDQIISFISSNLELELTEQQLERLDGYLVVSFSVDTLGIMCNHRISKSLNTWVDYAIIGALKSLPEWGVPSYRNDNKVERRHQVVFSFGSYVKGGAMYGDQSHHQHARVLEDVDRQRVDYYSSLGRERQRWDSFTLDNSRLEYDVEGGLRSEARVEDERDILLPGGGVIVGPTIRISE